MELTLGRASLLLRLVGPSANASFRIKHQTSRARYHIKLSVDAVKECVAIFGIFVREIAVLARTVRRRPRFLCRKKATMNGVIKRDILTILIYADCK